MRGPPRGARVRGASRVVGVGFRGAVSAAVWKAGRRGDAVGGGWRRLWTRAGPFSRITSAAVPVGVPFAGAPRRVASAGA